MFRDFELERLEAVKEIAFEDKENCFKLEQELEGRLFGKNIELSESFQEKQQAYAEYDLVWQEHQRVHSANDARIKRLTYLQEKAYRKMKKAYDSATDFYSNKNGVSASVHSGKGVRQKNKSESHAAEKRKLMDEVVAINNELSFAKKVVEQRKEHFLALKSEYDQLRLDVDLARENSRVAKTEFEDAVKAYQDRTYMAVSRQKLGSDKEIEMAKSIGIPKQYFHAMRVRYQLTGDIDFFFGGADDPIGPGHGHYVVSQKGKVKYRRNPIDYNLSKKFLYGDDNLFKSAF